MQVVFGIIHPFFFLREEDEFIYVGTYVDWLAMGGSSGIDGGSGEEAWVMFSRDEAHVLEDTIDHIIPVLRGTAEIV